MRSNCSYCIPWFKVLSLFGPGILYLDTHCRKAVYFVSIVNQSRPLSPAELENIIRKTKQNE